MSDNYADVILTVGAAFAAALFLAYHHGKGTSQTVVQNNVQLPSPPPPPSLGQISGDAANAARFYNPNTDIPNGFAINLLGSANLTLDQRPINIIVNTTSPIYNIPPGELIPINNETINLVQNLTVVGGPSAPGTPANVSSGTPACGCSQSDFSTLDAIAAAEGAAYFKTLAAIMAIPPVEPASNIYVTVQRPAQQFAGGINLTSQKSYDVVGALGDVVTHFLGYNN